MTMTNHQSGFLKVQNQNPEETLRQVFAGWLREHRLTAIMAPALSSACSATLALVSEPEKLASVMPLQPAMAVNAASVVHEIAGGSGAGDTVGLLLRPCELRAVVELVKLRQILTDNLVLIGIDCPGTYRAAGFRELRRDDSDFDNKHVRNQQEYVSNVNFRIACQMCEFAKPLTFDLCIGWLGMDPDKELFFEAATEKGKGLLEHLELSVAAEPEARKQYLAEHARKRKERAKERVEQMDKQMMGAENIVGYFADCLNCHNCMKVCPVCYCHECFFDSDTFKRDLDEHVRVSRRKGLSRMPSETLLFHLTRMNHMMTSCVACGICEDSCPVTIGLATLFKKVSQNAQQEFDYLAGRSLEEPLPLTTFREDEFKKVGEE